MAHEFKKKFLAEIAYTERDFQEAHTAFGNQANFDYELNDLNTQLLEILNGNALINGYFYEFEGDRLLTMPHIKGNAYVILTVNKASGQVSFSVDDRPKPMENEFEHNVIVFVVEMNFDKIVKVNRTTQDDIFRYVQDLSEDVEHAKEEIDNNVTKWVTIASDFTVRDSNNVNKPVKIKKTGIVKHLRIESRFDGTFEYFNVKRTSGNVWLSFWRKRNSSGHYGINANINEKEIFFMYDGGEDMLDVKTLKVVYE